KMVNCISCSAPLNVRSLFPRNSVREWIRILTGVAPSIRVSATGAGALYWGVALASMLGHVKRIPQVQTLLQNRWFRYVYGGTGIATIIFLYRITMGQIGRGFQEGDRVALLAGLGAGLVKVIRMEPSLPLKQQMVACVVAPLVAAIVALARALRR
ncbi:MAG TPA: hypothetical protein VGO47_14885, partial [Chlamydiales bacterium]|nr:hypothetical protein [Chlamydiales bacterium]